MWGLHRIRIKQFCWWCSDVSVFFYIFIKHVFYYCEVILTNINWYYSNCAWFIHFESFCKWTRLIYEIQTFSCFVSSMVSSYLVHHGYCATATAFARATETMIQEDQTSIKNRQSEWTNQSHTFLLDMQILQSLNVLN